MEGPIRCVRIKAEEVSRPVEEKVKEMGRPVKGRWIVTVLGQTKVFQNV